MCAEVVMYDRQHTHSAVVLMSARNQHEHMNHDRWSMHAGSRPRTPPPPAITQK